jgi:para-nitrobenzyl esterase
MRTTSATTTGFAAAWTLGTVLLAAAVAPAAERIETTAGVVEGFTSPESAVRVFLGVPYAAPPVGERRWRPPVPVTPWEGVRKATDFGSRCMQDRVFDDMVFRDEPSEDCLYLNVWTPAESADARLPVMVWIYGGGFQAGSASEPRQDGERLASDRDVVVVSMNYRLGIFGFFSHPELTKESAHGASGNYGLMDQTAALRWVKENIARFGGDPGNVTIFGESAGSFSVSAQVASPLARGLVHKAIGESGAFFRLGDSSPLATLSLTASEMAGAEFATSIGKDSLAALRALSAEELLQAAVDSKRWFAPNIDGHFMPKAAYEIYDAGEQAHVSLLAGWNADEVRAGVVLGEEEVTAQSFTAQTRERFGEAAEGLLKVYPAGSDAEALESASTLAGDLFIGYSTWKWIEMHLETGRSPVYRYSFDRKIPVAPGTKVNGKEATAEDVGARHAGEIEYVFGTLDSVPDVTWPEADRELSELMMTYWSNFARTGDPSGSGIPAWPRYEGGEGGLVMHLDVKSGARPDATRARYEVLDALAAAARQAARRGPTPNDTLVSAEIAPDRRVTFRIYAPRASEVLLTGDLIDGYATAPLTRGDRGVWSVTVGPLDPDYYSYSFVVDGVKTIDPKNPEIKQGVRSVDSMVLVPGPGAEYLEASPVPHGEIRIAWYESTTLGEQRRLHVYAPPGYDASTDRYPVLYLLHGGGDEDSGWSTIGRAGFIMDNLLAEGEALPALIVMPNGSLPRPADFPRSVPGQTRSPEARAAYAALQARFTSELMNDVVPFVEKTYRVRTDPGDRAIAGLSMGGGQTQRVLATHPGAFGYVAIWSAGVRPESTREFEEQAASLLADPEKANETIRLLSIRVGEDDFTLAGCRNLDELLTQHGIEHTLEVNDGGHTWINWRRYLSELLPKLFR